MKVLFITLLIVIVDQVSKLIVKGISIPFLNINLKGLNYGEKIPVIDGLFNITLIENPGIAFGIYLGEYFKFLVSVLTIAITIGMVFYIYMIKDKQPALRLSLAVILGGAIGNLIDRMFYGVFFDYAPLFYGKVVDFFDFRFLSTEFLNKSAANYIFNIADVAVTAGVVILFYALYREKKEASEAVPAVENSLAGNKD